MWSNFHTHSQYCDGKGIFQDYIEKGNLISLGFSSHAPIPFDCKWCMKQERLNSYLSEIELLKKQASSLELYTGLEVDYIPKTISPKDFENKLDYSVGSIHFVDTFSNGTHWEIDGLHTLFLDGLEKIFHNDIKAVITRYFELTREMISISQPTIVGHLDKIKIQNQNNKFFQESDPWYKEEITKTLKVIKSYGTIVEVNTRGLYQKKSDTTYPSPWILQLIHQLQIPVTLSSDAHHPDDITNQFEESAKMLRDIGFQTLSVLKEGRWQAFNFNQTGLLF